MSFKELRVFIAEKGQPCKDYLNVEAKKSGRNWTQLSTEEMKTLLSSYSIGKSSSSKSSSSKASAKVTKAAEKVNEEDLKKEFAELKKGFC